MKKAVVFAGGGSKGAYQIGAWRALNELSEEFDIATGTSIGSINAALYVQHDYERADELWTGLKVGDIMTNGISLERSLYLMYEQRDQLAGFLKTYINSKGADVTPFYKKIAQYSNAEKFFSSEIDFALLTVRFPSLEPCEIRKSDMKTEEDLNNWISASCACFPVFPVRKIDGKDYVDGGYYDNVPIASAIRLGAEQIVAIDLNYEGVHDGYSHHPMVKYIRPSRDLGSFMNFERNVLDSSINLGYRDVMKAYGRYFGNRYTFVPEPEKSDYYNALADEYLSSLTVTEASVDFARSLKLSRINKLPGCTTLLAETCRNNTPGAVDFFFASLELLMSILGMDDTTEYRTEELLRELKMKADLLYPFLSYDIPTALIKLEAFIKSETGKKISDFKVLDDEHRRIILICILRALQDLK